MVNSSKERIIIMKKQRIELRDKIGERKGYICRLLLGQIGNSDIAYCNYKKKKYLIKIDTGQNSSRGYSSNLTNLYIEVED